MAGLDVVEEGVLPTLTQREPSRVNAARVIHCGSLAAIRIGEAIWVVEASIGPFDDCSTLSTGDGSVNNQKRGKRPLDW